MAMAQLKSNRAAHGAEKATNKSQRAAQNFAALAEIQKEKAAKKAYQAALKTAYIQDPQHAQPLKLRAT